MVGIEKSGKNLAVKRFGPPPSTNTSAYAATLHSNAEAATSFLVELEKKTKKSLDERVETDDGIRIEHLGVLFFLHDLYLNDFISVLTKLEEHQFARELKTGVNDWVDKPVQITTANIPVELQKSLGVPTPPPDLIELSMSALARIHRVKALKLNQPEYFAFLVDFFIAQYKINPTTNSNFINTLMTTLVMDQKDLALIRNKLNRQNVYKSPEVITALMSNVELLQKFADIFLVALVDIEHPDHVAAQKLLTTLLSDYQPNSNLRENNVTTFVCSAFSQALMTRARTNEGQKKLGFLPGDWLIRFEELDETSSETRLSFEHLAKGIAREVENDVSRNQSFVVNSRTFLENIPAYAQTLNRFIAENQIKQARNEKKEVTVDELQKTSNFISSLLDQIKAPFLPVPAQELTLPELKNQFPFINFSQDKTTTLSQETLQLSPALKEVFPTLKSIEISHGSENSESAAVHFIVRSNRVLGRKDQIDDYFSFTLAMSATEGVILPDLLELKQYDQEALKNDPAAQTINQLLCHLALQTLENLNQKQAPKEKISSQKISTVIISGLTGNERPSQPQNLRKAKTVTKESKTTNPAANETKRKPAKIQLIADNLAEFDLTRFGVPAAEVVEKIMEAVALWNKEGNLTQSQLRSQPNLYRLACKVGTTPIRVFFEIRPDTTVSTGKRLTITDIRKRNSHTYKRLS